MPSSRLRIWRTPVLDCEVLHGWLRWEEAACGAGGLRSILGQEDPLEKGLAPHSSIPACRIPWTEEPGGLQSMRLQRVGHY